MSTYIKKIRTESGDLQIDYNALANLPQLNTMFSNPNLLINADFRNPVNQRGLSKYAYPANYSLKSYGVDRWWLKGTGSTMEIHDGYVSVVLPSGCDLGQTIDMRYKSYSDVTVSVKCYCDDIIKLATLNNLSSMGENTEQFISLTDSINVGFFVTNNNMNMFLRSVNKQSTLNIEWIKLEYGVIGTEFDIRLYAEELNLCRYYYQVLTFHNNDILCYLTKKKSGLYGGVIHYIPMRDIPSVSKTGGLYIELHNPTNNNVYSMTEDQWTDFVWAAQESALRFGVEYATNDIINCLAATDATCKIILDAEIY